MSALPAHPNETRLSPTRRIVLVSSFACSPLWGSEPGVGWQWLLHIAKRHQVVLLTHAFFRDHLEPALAQAQIDVEVHYLRPPAFGLHPHVQLNSRVYYTWWQWFARRYATGLVKKHKFDLIHHLTWGSLRFPCFLTGLGVPLVMGPLGGGESAPMRFFKGLPWRTRAFDLLRSASLRWVHLDPLATWGPLRSDLVLCRSADSLQALPYSVRERAVVCGEIGSPAIVVKKREERPTPNQNRRIKLLFAGRLIGWKGVSLAVGAVANLRRRGWDVQLDIAGDGPLRQFLAKRISSEGLEDCVSLLGVVPRPLLMEMYGQADLFLFPSLHDSGGTVVLEALSRGLPVICLDLGGPQNYLNTECGVVVGTRDLDRLELEYALAEAIAPLLAHPERISLMSRAAERHAQAQSWEAMVAAGYAHIHRRLNWSAPCQHASATQGVQWRERC